LRWEFSGAGGTSTAATSAPLGDTATRTAHDSGAGDLGS
jgi:hypothetical protein